MGKFKDCGHPYDWTLKLRYGGKAYTYCMGCLIETTKLNNKEKYDNPFIKVKQNEKNK